MKNRYPTQSISPPFLLKRMAHSAHLATCLLAFRSLVPKVVSRAQRIKFSIFSSMVEIPSLIEQTFHLADWEVEAGQTALIFRHQVPRSFKLARTTYPQNLGSENDSKNNFFLLIKTAMALFSSQVTRFAQTMGKREEASQFLRAQDAMG